MFPTSRIFPQAASNVYSGSGDRSPFFRSGLVCGGVLAALFLSGGATGLRAGVRLTYSWYDNSDNECGFRVERSTDGSIFTELTTVDADVTSYVDSTVEPGRHYWYRVAAFNAGGDSPLSAVVDGAAPAAVARTNTAPTISSLRDLTVPVGTIVPAISFVVGDGEMAAADLTVIGNTSNHELVPVENLHFAGTGASRSLTVTPTANLAGWSTIWVKVSDGSLSTVTSFVLVMASRTPAPTPEPTPDPAPVQPDPEAMNEPSPPKGRLLNLSARGRAATSDPLTVGFVVAGGATKQVLVRAIGPTMSQAPFNVASALADPRLALMRWNGTGYGTYAENADWWSGSGGAAIENAARQLSAFTLAEESRDAALLLAVPTGQYTAIVDDGSGPAGTALVELYDADHAADTQLINVSTRGYVGVGDEVLISGFVVSNEGDVRVLIRAVGPGLAAAPYHVPGTLADPEIELFQLQSTGDSISIFRQNDWSTEADAAQTASVAAQVGAFPLAAGSRDAAAVITLAPGVYTAVVRGVGETTGTALAEIYDANNP